MDLIFDLLILAFFGRGELLMPVRTLSFGFGIVLENTRFIICYDMFEKKNFVIFDAFKKVQAHISSISFLFVCEFFFFGTSFAQIFRMSNSSVKMLRTV